jgi:hypothetical protein
VTVYRGVMLYGESGVGKSSLINAGLFPEAERLGFHPERLRVQPRAGEELVLQRIATAGDDAGLLPSLLAPEHDSSSRIVLSTNVLEERLADACTSYRPLIVFDQFEEIVTLFEEAGAGEARQRLVELIVRLLRGPLPVKLLFAFRQDYLSKVKQLLAACPELVDQALLLTPPAADTLPTIIRGPFESYPGQFARELSPELAERLRTALAERFSAGDLSLSEVQTVCLRLWQADEPEALLAAKGVQGLLEDYVGEALEAFPPDLRGAAIAVLGQMLTSAGTRNVMSAEDLIQRVREDEDIPPPLLQEALERLESESRLVRRERRRDLYLYEITSEFLVPWISGRRDEFRRDQDRRRYRRRLRVLGALAGVVVLVVAAVAVRGLDRASDQESAAKKGTSEALLTLLPASIRASCTNDPEQQWMVNNNGALAQANCDAGTDYLTYGLWESSRKARKGLGEPLPPGTRDCSASTNAAMKKILPEAARACFDSVKENEGLAKGIVMVWNENKSPVAGYFQSVDNRNQEVALDKWEQVVRPVARE